MDPVLDKTAHDEVVRDIATNRFGLDEWTISTHTGMTSGATPDIVATNSDQVVAVGEIETGPVCDERARKWKAFGESCARFYLYVPEASVKEAAELIAKHNVMCAGLRTFQYNGKLEIKPVYLEDVRIKEEDHPWWMGLGSNEGIC